MCSEFVLLKSSCGKCNQCDDGESAYTLAQAGRGGLATAAHVRPFAAMATGSDRSVFLQDVPEVPPGEDQPGPRFLPGLPPPLRSPSSDFPTDHRSGAATSGAATSEARAKR